MIGAVYHLGWSLVVGGLILGGCCFVAGWVSHREHELYLRSSGRRRRRDAIQTRTPW